MTKNEEITQRLTKAAEHIKDGRTGLSSLDNTQGLIDELSAILAELYNKVEALEIPCSEFECDHAAYEHDETGCRAGVETDEGYVQCSCMKFKRSK